MKNKELKDSNDWKQTRFNVVRRDGYRCKTCASTINLEIKSNSDINKDPSLYAIDTFETSCVSCKKSNNTLFTYDIKGFRVDFKFVYNEKVVPFAVPYTCDITKRTVFNKTLITRIKANDYKTKTNYPFPVKDINGYYI